MMQIVLSLLMLLAPVQQGKMRSSSVVGEYYIVRDTMTDKGYKLPLDFVQQVKAKIMALDHKKGRAYRDRGLTREKYAALFVGKAGHRFVIVGKFSDRD